MSEQEVEHSREVPLNLPGLWFLADPLPNWIDEGDWRSREREAELEPAFDHDADEAWWDRYRDFRDRWSSMDQYIGGLIEERVAGDTDLAALIEDQRRLFDDKIDLQRDELAAQIVSLAESRRPPDGGPELLGIPQIDRLRQSPSAAVAHLDSAAFSFVGAGCYGGKSVGTVCKDNDETADFLVIDAAYSTDVFDYDDFVVAANPQRWPTVSGFWDPATTVSWAYQNLQLAQFEWISRGQLVEHVRLPNAPSGVYGPVTLDIIRHQVEWNVTYTYWLADDPGGLETDEGVFAASRMCEEPFRYRVGMLKRLGPPSAPIIDPTAFQVVCGVWIDKLQQMFK